MSPRRRTEPTEAAAPGTTPAAEAPAAESAGAADSTTPEEPTAAAPQKRKGGRKAGAKKKDEKEKGKKKDGKGEKEKKPLTREQRMALLDAQLKKSYGTNVMFDTADQVEYVWDLRRPTNIWQLDVDLHGGLPADCMVQITGADGAGKTQLGLLTLAAVQSIYGDDFFGVYASHGLGLNLGQARGAGAVIPATQRELDRARRKYFDDFGMVMPPEIEQSLLLKKGRYMVLEVGEGELADTKPSEAMMDALIDIVSSGLAQVVFLDEGAGSIPTADRIAKPLSGEDSARVGDQSSFVAEFLRKLTPAMKKRYSGRPIETTVLFTTQRRIEIGANKYQKHTHAAGGMALGYYKAMDIEVWVNHQIKRGDDAIGREMGYRITKGKLGVHEGATGLVHTYFDRPGLIDRVHDLHECCRRFGLIKGSNANLRLVLPNGAELMKTDKGAAGVREYLTTNPQLHDELRNHVFGTIKDQWRHV